MPALVPVWLTKSIVSVEDCYQAAKTIIEQDSVRIEKLAQKLLEKETVLADEFRALCEEAPSQVDIKSIKLP
jgi:ATP-dependent Zn protease